MVDEIARGYIKRIFEDHWDEFLNRYEHRVRPVVIKEVRKMLECGNFENGYAKYQCSKCGETKKVPFRCKSRFCGTCGKVMHHVGGTAGIQDAILCDSIILTKDLIQNT